MSANKNYETIEVIDATESRSSESSKTCGKATSEFRVLAKAASIYFEKLSELNEASESKRKFGSASDFLSNLDAANRAAWKHVVDNSETHKDNEKLAKRFLPDSAINNLHDWLAGSK